MSIIIKSGTSGNLAAVTTDGELSTAADNQTHNGTTWEKAKTATAANATTGTGVPAAGILGHDGTNYRRVKVGAAGDIAVSITNPEAALAGFYATVDPFGAVSVSGDPQPLLIDTFEGAGIDTLNKWTLSGTVPATNTLSTLLVNPDVTANATCAVTSQPTFQIASSILMGCDVTLEITPATGNHRFWGLGVPPSTPGTAAAPLQEAVGFEVDTTGALRACVYTGGVRVWNQAMVRPADGLPHLFLLQARGDVAFFFMDDFAIPAAFSYIGPAIKQLPVRAASLNGAVITGTPTMSVTGLGLLDPSRTGSGISDGTYAWRKAKVDTAGALATASRAADLAVSATASVTSAVTATLPAAGAGLFHYITYIEIIRYATAIITGSSTPNVVTTTNLPGSLAWTCSTAGAAGTITDRYIEDYAGAPLKSSVANTNTTVVGPGTSNVIWRINVHYYTAP